MVPITFPTAVRAGQRFHLSLPITVRVREDSIPIHPGRKSVPVAQTTTTANISSRGCYFPLSWKLPLGTRLELQGVARFQNEVRVASGARQFIRIHPEFTGPCPFIRVIRLRCGHQQICKPRDRCHQQCSHWRAPNRPAKAHRNLGACRIYLKTTISRVATNHQRPSFL